MVIRKVVIRKARLQDVNSCYELSKIRELLTAKKEPIPLNYFKAIVKDKRTIFLVAEKKGKIIGYPTADLLPGRLAIWWLLSVNPEYQNRGIGKELAKNIEKECKKRGIKDIIGYTPKFNKKLLLSIKN